MIRSWLVEYREVVGLTHEEVAEAIGTTRQYYSMIENGTRNPSVEVAKKIGDVLDFSWTLFFEQTGNKTLLCVKEKESA
jgi:putative transcriptional regulator